MSHIEISHIPHKPGVYIFKNRKGVILYIGKAKDLKNRVKQYFAAGSMWKQDMVQKATEIEFLIVSTESEALFLEDNLIKRNKPQYNNILKGDNSYAYIKITNHEFPEIFLTRYRVNDGSIYIGPKFMKQELKKLLQFLRILLQYRGCKPTQFNQGELCSDFLFGLCKGRCVFAKLKQKNREDYTEKAIKLGQKITKTYEEYIIESKDLVSLLVSFFSGNTKPVLKEIKEQIAQCIVSENFERAGKLRDIYFHIEKFVEKQHVVLDMSVTGRILKRKKIGDRYVYVVLNFFEGKLIDVITRKEKSSEISLNEVIAVLESEYGDFIYYVENNASTGTLRVVNREEMDDYVEVIIVQNSISKISKKILKEVNELCEKFIGSVILNSSFEKDSVMNSVLSQLQERYFLKKYPYRIECVDISHLSGGWMAGGLSCVVGGIPLKKFYRKYKIQTVDTTEQQNNDYKALEEVLIRRFFNNEEKPDIMVIDGGLGQLGVVKKLLENSKKFRENSEGVCFVSLGKGDARKRSGKIQGEHERILTLMDNGEVIETEMIYDEVDRVFIQLRDEAHRFANVYRKKRMSMEWKT